MDRFEKNVRDATVSEAEKEQRWDKIHSRGATRIELEQQYDGWLEQCKEIETILEKCTTPILDLGCGLGIDTVHLINKGHDVIATDFSSKAIELIRTNIPEAKTIQFNMKDKFPFEDELFEFIIANKSIHYFSELETKSIISELYRILKPNGIFSFVVNSTNDNNFGAGQGTLLENNYYEVRGTTKRFFDKLALETFFDKEHWQFIYMNEGDIQDERIKSVQMQNPEKILKKTTWTCAVKKI